MKISMILLFLIISLYLSADQLDDIYNQIIDEYSKISSFEATLIQENHWSEIDRTKSTTGKIYYNTDSLYVSYDPPDEQELFVQENTVIMHDKKSGQAIYMDKGDFLIRPLSIIKSYWNESEKQLLPVQDDFIMLLIKRADEEIIISLKSGLITSLLITDKDNNSVKYQFLDEKINSVLPKSIFIPAFPENTNIIDNRTNGE
ncbi:MAG: outer-membrane lipoprotein carrier protein LolA [Candidatus Stygibacter australis]|nr:outer-membrane lipoprotein carrier protein LolA [Candidatus Stygibacter australis]